MKFSKTRVDAAASRPGSEGDPPAEGSATPESPPAEAGAPADAAARGESQTNAGTVGGDAGASAQPVAAAAAAEIQSLRDRWLRAEAELQNFRRRTLRDLEEARRVAEESVLLDVMSCLDDLERAIAAAAEAGVEAAWRQGLELVAQRMRDLFTRAGITRIEAAGEPFDPHRHEALLEVPAPEGTVPGRVVHVIRAGYERGDRVLRPARVAVAAEPPPSEGA